MATTRAGGESGKCGSRMAASGCSRSGNSRACSSVAATTQWYPMLRSMGYHCVVAATLEHALELPEREQPDAAILDPHFPDSPPARVVAMFHKRVPDLRNHFIVLVDRKSTRLNSSHGL